MKRLLPYSLFFFRCVNLYFPFFSVPSRSHRSFNQPHVTVVSIDSLEFDIVVFFLLFLLHLLLSEARLNLQFAQSPSHVISLQVLPPDEGRSGVYFEAVDARDVSLDALGGDERWVDLEDDVVEGGAEVGTVDGGVTGGLWVVEILAAGAVELDWFEVGDIGEAHGKEGMGVAVDARAFSKLGLFVLVELFQGNIG